jgi:hypothetical protein
MGAFTGMRIVLSALRQLAVVPTILPSQVMFAPFV